jgi:tight adherence protein B
MPQITLDPALAIQILIFAAVFAAAQAVWGLSRMGVAKRVVNQRLTLVESGMALGAIVGELRKRRGLKENGEGRMGWLADLIIRSGVAYQPRRWAMIVAGLGLGTALVVYLFTRMLWLAPIFGVVAAVAPPIIYLKFKAGRRAKGLTRQLPEALEVIVRSLEAGHPVPTAIAMVGREMPDPIGTEFGMAADEIAYGSTLELAVANMAGRCRHPDIDLFAATIRLQERSGGNLTGLLKMNAHTVRERAKLRMKIAAATAEGRISATILTAAPFCVLGILELIQPNFYGSVIHEKAIHWGLGFLGTWMLLGNLVMRKMIDVRI